MVDHTFVYTGAVRKIRELVDEGALGEIYYFDSVRVNLGLFQHDVSVLWDLAVHDLSILDYVLGQRSRGGVGHRREPRAGRAGERRLPDAASSPNSLHRAHPRQLAGAGQDPPDADRRQREDDRLRRPRAEREGQGLRQGRHASNPQPGGCLRDAGRLPHRRHVGAPPRDHRGASRRGGRVRSLHREWRIAGDGRGRRPARGRDPRGGHALDGATAAARWSWAEVDVGLAHDRVPSPAAFTPELRASGVRGSGQPPRAAPAAARPGAPRGRAGDRRGRRPQPRRDVLRRSRVGRA